MAACYRMVLLGSSESQNGSYHPTSRATATQRKHRSQHRRICGNVNKRPPGHCAAGLNIPPGNCRRFIKDIPVNGNERPCAQAHGLVSSSGRQTSPNPDAPASPSRLSMHHHVNPRRHAPSVRRQVPAEAHAPLPALLS